MIRPPAWHAQAACATPDTATLFRLPRGGENLEQRREREGAALAVCATCVVRHPCLDDALIPGQTAQSEEVQGGMRRRERLREREHRRRGGIPRYAMGRPARRRVLVDSANTVRLLHDLLGQGHTLEGLSVASGVNLRTLQRLRRTPAQPTVAEDTAYRVAELHRCRTGQEAA